MSWFTVLLWGSILLPILVAVAYLTLTERLVMAAMQKREGPNIVGMFGLLQPLADGLKLFVKESVFPSAANLVLFFCSPVLTFFLALFSWIFLPIHLASCSDVNVGVLCILAVSSLAVYGIVCSGWASNSKYSFLGALRSTAQMISYEISIGLIIMSILCCVGTVNLTVVAYVQNYFGWFALPLFPAFCMFLISSLAETNRAPYDLPEAESELVAGYNTEYSAFGFALFFLGEYCNMILMSALLVVFFLGSSSLPFFAVKGSLLQGIIFGSKTAAVLFVFVWVRASFPRKRYDQLMFFGWKVLLPLALGFLFFVASYLFFLNGFILL